MQRALVPASGPRGQNIPDVDHVRVLLGRNGDPFVERWVQDFEPLFAGVLEEERDGAKVGVRAGCRQCQCQRAS